MINVLENQTINVSKLPDEWKTTEARKELEKFLQNNWEQRKSFYTDKSPSSKQLFVYFNLDDTIRTNKYIGTILFKGQQMNIFPKVFKDNEDEFDSESLNINELNENLLMWIKYCDKNFFPFINTKTEISDNDSLLELLITVYTRYVKNTVDKQRYYQYEDISEEGPSPKGKINFNDYLNRNFVNGNRHIMNYTYSSFIYDNLLNRIIKYTCRIIYKITNQETIKEELREILLRFSNVSDQLCTPYDCDKVHLDSMHTNYGTILSMSKMFLFGNTSMNSIGLYDSFCFLFPSELLFEGFVSGFMKEKFKDTIDIKTQSNDQYLAELYINGENRGNRINLREDILININGNNIVLDTKYKPIENLSVIKDTGDSSVNENDIRQVAFYAAKRNAIKAYLIYPLYRKESIEDIDVTYKIDVFNDKSKIIPVSIIKVPFIFGSSVEDDTKKLESILLKTFK